MSESSQPHASLSVTEGVAMMVGIVVGIGIFMTPPLVASNVDSEWAFEGAWILGGVVTLLGALCYAELASAYPKSTGEHHFLTRAYGRTVALFFAWARSTVIQTGAIAAVAFVYGDYAQQLLPLGPYGAAIHGAVVVIAMTALNVLGTPQSKRVQVVLTGLSLLALLAVIVAGFVANGSDAAAAAPAADPSPSGGAFGMAMVFVLLTYGGWNEAAYLSGEMRDARRDMVKVLVAGTAIIAVAYGVVNLAYLNVFGLEGLRGTSVAAAELMRIAVGDSAAVVMSLVVCIMAISTINGTIFTGGRTYQALADVSVLAPLAAWDARGRTPTNGLLAQGAIALALIVFGAVTRDGFRAMVDFTAPVFWFFMLLVSISVFVLRHREPDQPRPYRVPLYPVVPALFTLTCAGLLYSSVTYTGLGALFGIAVLLAGTPLLFMQRPASRAPAE